MLLFQQTLVRYHIVQSLGMVDYYQMVYVGILLKYVRFQFHYNLLTLKLKQIIDWYHLECFL
jgi:hypothetical protein